MQEGTLELSRDVRICRGCGTRRVVCAFGTCGACHARGRSTAPWWVADREPVHLCCGWWGPLSVLPWMCITCGALRTRRHA